MKLKTKQLKEFMQLSSSIVSNSIIPIYDYLLLSSNRLDKSNGRTFISHAIDAEISEPLLLEERVLSNFVKLSKAEEINVKVDGMKVTLSDGVGKQHFQTVDAKDFPTMPELNKEDGFELDEGMIEAISIAAKNTSNVGANANLDFVHLYDGYIFGTDSRKIYCKKEKGIPNAIIDVHCASVISQFRSLKFYDMESNYFFETDKTLYGFQKFGDVKPVKEIKQFVERKMEGDYFEFNVADFLYFCDLVTGSIKLGGNEVFDCMWRGAELSYNHAEQDKVTEYTLPHEGSLDVLLSFNPKYFAPYFKSLGIPRVRLYHFKPTMVFISDPDDPLFIGMIAGLAM